MAPAGTVDAPPEKVPAVNGRADGKAPIPAQSGSSTAMSKALTSAFASGQTSDGPGGAPSLASDPSFSGTSAAKLVAAGRADAVDDGARKSSTHTQSAHAPDGTHAANNRMHGKPRVAGAKMTLARAQESIRGQLAVAAPGLVPAVAAARPAAASGAPEAQSRPMPAELPETPSGGFAGDPSGRTERAQQSAETSAGILKAAKRGAAGHATIQSPVGNDARAAEDALASHLAEVRGGVREDPRGTASAGPDSGSAGLSIQERTVQSGPPQSQDLAPGQNQVQPLSGEPSEVQAQLDGQAAVDQAASEAGKESVHAVGGIASIPAAAQKAVQPSDQHPSLAATMRIAHGSTVPDTNPHGGISLQPQAGGALASAPAWAANSAGAHQTATVSGRLAAVSSAAPADLSAHAAFAALDHPVGPETPSWVHAGTHRAEAGFQDPSLGWIGVRADLSAGGVHATLMPGSVEAAQRLSAHMAGLNAYLTDHHAAVATLSMATPGGHGMSAHTGQGMNPGGGQHSGQGTPSGSYPPQPGSAAVSAASFQGASAVSGQSEEAAQLVWQAGAHISVIA